MVPVSALLTGQPFLATSAMVANSSAEMPGTDARVVRWLPVMPLPGWKLTSALVSTRSTV